jgi:hypothetical protein
MRGILVGIFVWLVLLFLLYGILLTPRQIEKTGAAFMVMAALPALVAGLWVAKRG